MATLKDVAKKAKVSLSTASYALNGGERVSKETREKVLKAAVELNYHPNGIARSLKKQKTNTIGLFVHDFSGPFYNEIIQGIQDSCKNFGYDLIVCTNNSSKRFLKEKLVDGAIIIDPYIPDDLLISVADRNFPIITMDRELNNDYIYNILLDNKKGAYDITTHLIKLGINTIGYISGPDNSYDNRRRFQGYKDALIDNNKRFSEKLVLHSDFTEKGGYEIVKEYAQKNSLPEAFFCSNDEMAIGAINALKELGIKIPEDIGIVGFDNINISKYISPQLTTVNIPRFNWGAKCVEILMKLLNKEQMSERLIMIPVELVVRNSCRNTSGRNGLSYD
ncbi:LacI family DNA-binding transcriptional regulator [Caldisalinibacter kiritimatiensis]|uniref:Ribose operon repressor n=1 Tax=Caldisalinibacter kiritimatiensis TaxID=1304284 RepID=R1AVH2_9FIRM|nr:LacI family DNA-binding transcriptional regulator [Caldisalinibacter kiritimatiensis]EOD01203.1 Ribose operon repressor [Caldisalinibacter kiritimatiensis]